VSAPGPSVPPEVQFTRELTKAAKLVERLKLRRRGLGRKLVAVNQQIRDGERALRVLASATNTVGPPEPMADREAAEELIDRAMQERQP